MPTLKLGPVRSVILFGGGEVLAVLEEKLRGMELAVQVVTSPRLLDETLKAGDTFRERIRRGGSPFFIYEELRADLPPLAQAKPDTLGLSIGATWIFREEVIRLFNGQLLNSHPACLPEGRGGGGFSWRILSGDRRGRSLVHQVDTGVDSGAVVAAREYTFPGECRIPQDFFDEHHSRDIAFFWDFLQKAMAGHTFELRPQDPALAAYWPRLDTDLHGAIDWDWEPGEIERFICAFDAPYRGAHTFLYGQKLRLRDCRIEESGKGFHPFQSGLIYRIHGGRVYVALRGGSVSLGRVLDEEGGEARFRPGDRFWTPRAVLEKARVSRVFHPSRGSYVRSTVQNAAGG